MPGVVPDDTDLICDAEQKCHQFNLDLPNPISCSANAKKTWEATLASTRLQRQQTSPQTPVHSLLKHSAGEAEQFAWMPDYSQGQASPQLDPVTSISGRGNVEQFPWDMLALELRSQRS
ncbi:hypothetical protein Bbelb_137500 [Branchiostoma belcheri]|nr:hypothetical protein Bbelb_137500 [Branchiostoma belcheri]